MSGCIVRGRLDLSTMNVSGDMRLDFIDVIDEVFPSEGMRPENPALDISNAVVRGDCSLDGLRVLSQGGIRGRGVKVGGDLRLNGVFASSECSLSDANISGTLLLGALFPAVRITKSNDEMALNEWWVLKGSLRAADTCFPPSEDIPPLHRNWHATLLDSLNLDRATIGAVSTVPVQYLEIDANLGDSDIFSVGIIPGHPLKLRGQQGAPSTLSMANVRCAGTLMLNGIAGVGLFDLRGADASRLLICPYAVAVKNSKGPRASIWTQLVVPFIEGELLAVAARTRLDTDITGLQIRPLAKDTRVFSSGSCRFDSADIGTNFRTYSDSRILDLQRWAADSILSIVDIGTNFRTYSDSRILQRWVDGARLDLQRWVDGARNDFLELFEPTRVAGDFSARDIKVGGDIVLSALKCAGKLDLSRADIKGAFTADIDVGLIPEISAKQKNALWGRTPVLAADLEMLTCRGDAKLSSLVVLCRNPNEALKDARIAKWTLPGHDGAEESLVPRLYGFQHLDERAKRHGLAEIGSDSKAEPPHLSMRRAEIRGRVELKSANAQMSDMSKQSSIFGSFDFSHGTCSELHLPDGGFSERCRHFRRDAIEYIAAGIGPDADGKTHDDMRLLGINLEAAQVGTLYWPEKVPEALNLTGCKIGQWREPNRRQALDYYRNVLAHDVDKFETTYKAVQQAFVDRSRDAEARMVYVEMRRRMRTARISGGFLGRFVRSALGKLLFPISKPVAWLADRLSDILFDYFTRPWKPMTLGVISVAFLASWLTIFSDPMNIKGNTHGWSLLNGGLEYTLRTFVPILDLGFPSQYAVSDRPVEISVPVEISNVASEFASSFRPHGARAPQQQPHRVVVAKLAVDKVWGGPWILPADILAALIRITMAIYWTIIAVVAGAGFLERRAVGA